MTPKKLHWRYIGKTDIHWVGMLPGEHPPVRFVLEKLFGERYLIKSDLGGVKKHCCNGLEAAKQQAQEMFDTYALSLFEFHGNGIAVSKKI